MSGGGAEDGIKGDQVVVVAVRLGIGGDAAGGSGGGQDVGGGLDRLDVYVLNWWGGRGGGVLQKI